MKFYGDPLCAAETEIAVPAGQLYGFTNPREPFCDESLERRARLKAGGKRFAFLACSHTFLAQSQRASILGRCSDVFLAQCVSRPVVLIYAHSSNIVGSGDRFQQLLRRTEVSASERVRRQFDHHLEWSQRRRRLWEQSRKT